MSNDLLTIGSGLGGIAFWNTRRCHRALAQAAADQVGLGHLVPSAPPRSTALRTCMAKVAVQHFGRIRKQPISIRELEQAGSFEAVRVRAGTTVNEYQHLFSACYSANDYWLTQIISSVRLIELGKMIEQSLQAAVLEERDYLPAPLVSAIMVKALRTWKATLLKEDGGVWFIPGPHLEAYRTFARHIGGKGTGPQFKLTQFEIGSDPDTVRHVLSSLRDEIRQGVDAIMDDVMRAEGGLADRSISLRANRASAFLDKVKLYEQVTGKTLNDLTDAIARAQQALAVNKLLGAAV